MCWPERLRWLPLLALCWLAAAQSAQLQCAALQRAAPVERAAVVHGQGLLWRVTGAAAGASYVLGTMHIAEARVMQVVDVIQQQFAASPLFAMEVVLDGAAMQKLGVAMFYADGRRLSKEVGAPLFASIARHLTDYGIPSALAENMKPWAAFITLSMPLGASAPPLDMQLMNAARQAGKQVVGLESVDEQLAVFDGVPDTDQIAMLRDVACHYQVFQQELAEMVDAYVARDLAALVEQSERYDSAGKEAFMDKLLYQRNVRMAERMVPLLAVGHAFIAVGALHLPGERGVLRLLERHGYRVEAVY